MWAWRRVAVAIAVAGGAGVAFWLVGTGGDEPRDSFRDVISGRAEERRRMIEERRRMEAQAEAAKRKQRLDAIPQVLGARPGQPGPLFAGVRFDHDEAVPADARDRIADFARATDARVQIFAKGDPGVTVDFVSNDDGVVDAITRAWGPIPPDAEWIDMPDRLVASLYHDHGRAALSWRPFQTIDDLIVPTDPDRFGFEPKPLLGASKDTVQQLMHAGDLVSDRELDMVLLPLQGGGVPVDVDFALDDHGLVSGFRIITQAPKVASDVEATLWIKYGRPPGDTVNGSDVVWHRRGATIREVLESDQSLTITVERAPR